MFQALRDDMDKNQNEKTQLAHEWVLQHSPTFMEQQIVKFLRAEGFDLRKATRRLKSHFQMKREFFGHLSLGRELELQDLGPEERDLLENGGIQLLPVRDRSGRGICLSFTGTTNQYSPMSKVGPESGQYGEHGCCSTTNSTRTVPMYQAKVMFWLCSIAARDVELQRRGVIWIFWAVGAKCEGFVNAGIQRSRIFAPSLARTAAIHVCFQDSAMTQTISSSISFLDTLSLIRLQSHFGSNLECRYNLMTFVSPSAMTDNFAGATSLSVSSPSLHLDVARNRGFPWAPSPLPTTTS
jgi:hypothetical protein